jgi:hypothetical protein
MGKIEAADEIPQCTNKREERKDLNTEIAEEAHRDHRDVRFKNSSEAERIADAEEFVGFGGGDAGVGGEAVEVVEAGAGGPGRKGGFAELGEAFLEAFEDFAGLGIARRNGAAGAGIAALEIYFADFEADYAALVFAEELIFPEGGDAVDFERGAEALADFVESDPRKTLRRWAEPLNHRFEGGGGDDGGAAGDGVVGEAVFGVADQNLLLEEDAEPFGGVIVGAGEGKGARGDFAAIAGDGEGDFAKVGRVGGADEMDRGGALAVHPLAVNGEEGPGAIEGEAAGEADAGFGDGDGVEGFDGVEADVDEVGRELRRGHGKSLAEDGSNEVMR